MLIQISISQSFENKIYTKSANLWNKDAQKSQYEKICEIQDGGQEMVVMVGWW